MITVGALLLVVVTVLLSMRLYSLIACMSRESQERSKHEATLRAEQKDLRFHMDMASRRMGELDVLLHSGDGNR